MERKISGHLKRWQGLPRCLCCATLYEDSKALQFAFSGLVEEYMIIRTEMLYKDSNDPKVNVSWYWGLLRHNMECYKRIVHCRRMFAAKQKDFHWCSCKRKNKFSLFSLIPNRQSQRTGMTSLDPRRYLDRYRRKKRMTKMVRLIWQEAWTRLGGYDKAEIKWLDFYGALITAT